MSDLRNGLRQLLRKPVVSLAAVLTLALGIGATTSMFSVVNGVLLQALPFPEPHRLVRLYHVNPGQNSDRAALSVPDLEDWARDATAFSAMAVFSDLPSGPLFTTGEEPLQLRTAYVSGAFFDVMGVPAALGRGLLKEEEYRDNRVVVVSHAFWQTVLGGDPSIVGGTVTLDDQAHRVAGVMPEGFDFPNDRVQAWMFLSVIPESSIPLQVRGVRFLSAVGRLADGVAPDRAQEELTTLSQALLERYPDQNEGLEGAAVVPLAETLTAGVSRPLTLLLVAVCAVLLIACVNVAGLLLSRGVERAREVAVRAALGASRPRLLRQFLGEAVLLAAVGGALGVGLAFLLQGVLTSQLPTLVPRAGEIRMDGAVLGFAGLVASMSALLFGTAPALVVTGAAPAGTLREGGRGATAGRGSRSLWNGLVATEVAVALVLVVTSGLLLRSLWALQGVDSGLADDRLVAAGLTFNDARYPERAHYMAAYDQVMARLSAVPGVSGVGSIRWAPARQRGEQTSFQIPGRPAGEEGRLRADLLQVSPGLFSVIGTPRVAGREFTPQDRVDAPRVVVVNEAFQRRFFPGESAVDRELLLGGSTTLRIVGVVGDIRQRGPAALPEPTLYVPQAQNPRRGMTFMVATTGDPEALLESVRLAIREVDADQPIEVLSPMEHLVDDASARERFFAIVLGGFGLLALLLASLGIYGVVATGVGRRTSEIGTRLALGANRRTILQMVVGGAMRPVLLGVAVGAGVAWVAVRALEGVVFGVNPRDPVTFLAVIGVLIAVATVASWIPAGRASRLDPVTALRAE